MLCYFIIYFIIVIYCFAVDRYDFELCGDCGTNIFMYEGNDFEKKKQSQVSLWECNKMLISVFIKIDSLIFEHKPTPKS